MCCHDGLYNPDTGSLVYLEKPEIFSLSYMNSQSIGVQFISVQGAPLRGRYSTILSAGQQNWRASLFDLSKF